MLGHQNLRIPRHSRKDGLDTTAHRSHEDLTDLQPDNKRESHDNRRERAVVVITRVCVLQVEVSEKRADVGNTHRAHGEHRSHETVVDQGVDAAVFHHCPGVFGRGDERFPVQGDVAEGVAVEEGDEPVEEGDEAAQDPEEDATHEIPFAGFVALRDGAGLAEHVDDCDDQAAETDAAEGVGGGAFEGAARGSFGQFSFWVLVAAEIPRAVDAGDGRVDGVLHPFAEPVHGEGDVDD